MLDVLACLLWRQDSKLELYVLLDSVLIETFLNRRAVISSFATHVFTQGPAPEERGVFVVQPPAGVVCQTHAYSLMTIAPPLPPPPPPPSPPPPSPPPKQCGTPAAGPVGMWKCADINNVSQTWSIKGTGPSPINLVDRPSLALALGGTHTIPYESFHSRMLCVSCACACRVRVCACMHVLRFLGCHTVRWSLYEQPRLVATTPTAREDPFLLLLLLLHVLRIPKVTTAFAIMWQV